MPSTQVWKTGFGPPSATNDRTALKGDVTGALHHALSGPRQTPDRTSRRQVGRTAAAAKQKLGSVGQKAFNSKPEERFELVGNFGLRGFKS